ncbi:MAG: aminoglycoside phosphotransferase family protein [Prosthecobacter sp.]|nr:aminoglycoside phosphotransferase family protein [Prosthecobacter sp.]
MNAHITFMPSTDLPIRAATETALAHGIKPDRCDILQDGNTLVIRLTETLVARVVQDVDGPRQGTAWFARENAIAQHLSQQEAPVIPLHPDLPPGPHEHQGYPLNFWLFVTALDAEPEASAVGRTLRRCHEVLQTFSEPLPKLAILTESLDLLETLEKRELFPESTLQLLRDRLVTSMEILSTFPHQPLHGDAHLGNLMNTTTGLLWTDWEDTFSGPVEWDVASVIWNAQILDEDHDTVKQILDAYRQAGGHVDSTALHHSLIARAAVMSAWYPILYPNPNEKRRMKLQHRLDWLATVNG